MESTFLLVFLKIHLFERQIDKEGEEKERKGGGLGGERERELSSTSSILK